MVAPWIKKKRARQAAAKAAKKTAPAPQPKAAKKAAPAPKPAPVVEEAPAVEVVPEAAPEAPAEEPALDLTSMYKWQLVSHAESLGHDVSGLTKTEILDLLAQD